MTNSARLLKEKRKARGLTQENLSSKLGLTTCQFISNIERGLVSIPPTRIKELATLLNIPVARLVKAHLEDYETKVRKTVST